MHKQFNTCANLTDDSAFLTDMHIVVLRIEMPAYQTACVSQECSGLRFESVFKEMADFGKTAAP